MARKVETVDSRLAGDIIGLRVAVRVLAQVIALGDDDDQNVLLRRMRAVAHGTLDTLEVEFAGYDETVALAAAHEVVDQAFRDYEPVRTQ